MKKNFPVLQDFHGYRISNGKLGPILVELELLSGRIVPPGGSIHYDSVWHDEFIHYCFIRVVMSQ